jgi:hypothetical protein
MTSSLKGLSDEEAHRAPPAVIEFGGRLEETMRLAFTQPEKAEEIQGFFKTCADSSGAITSIRALCLTGYLELAKHQGSDLVISELEMAPEVVRLAIQLQERGLSL